MRRVDAPPAPAFGGWGFRNEPLGFPFTWRPLNGEETLTVDDPLHPPNAKSDDEADGIPGAAGPVGHRGGHHGGQGQHDDGAVKHLMGTRQREQPENSCRHSRAATSRNVITDCLYSQLIKERKQMVYKLTEKWAVLKVQSVKI